MIRKISLITMVCSLFIAGVVLVGVPSRVFAATREACTAHGSSFLGFPTWYKYLQPEFVEGTEGSPAECKIQFDITKDVGKVLLAVIEIMLRVSGIVAVGFIIYGGFQYILSQGEPDKAKSARQTIINALIGLIVAMLATAVVNVVAGNLIT